MGKLRIFLDMFTSTYLVLMVGSFWAQIIQSRQLSPLHIYRLILLPSPAPIFLPTYLVITFRKGKMYLGGKVI